MKNILVAISFDQNEWHLLKHAETLAKKFDAKIWLVHTAAPDTDFVSMKASSQYERDARSDELIAQHKQLRNMGEDLESKGLVVEPLLIQGSTVKTLLEKATDISADLIITGLHEHGFFYNAIIGNTSLQLLRSSRIPVLTIPVGD